MRISTLFALFAIANVEAVELHSHQKAVSGAHAKRMPRALAQQKSKAKNEKLNFNKLKQKAAKAKEWAQAEAAKVQEDV